MNPEKESLRDLPDTLETTPLEEAGKISSTSAIVHQRIDNVLYSRRFGLAKYEVAQESEETLAGWQREIEEMKSTLMSNDKSSVKALMSRDEKIRGDLENVMTMLENENLNERDLTLVAIGLWLLREKSRWKGALYAGLKMIKGGKFTLSSFLQKEGNATCLDTCILFNELAKRFGINGNIYVTDNHRFGHRIWKAGSGETVDISYAWRRGGFFKNETTFSEYVKKNKELPWNLRKPYKYVLEPASH